MAGARGAGVEMTLSFMCVSVFVCDYVHFTFYLCVCMWPGTVGEGAGTFDHVPRVAPDTAARTSRFLRGNFLMCS